MSAGWVITATATLEPLGATSEFSACVVAEPGGAASVPVDGAVEEAGIRLHAASPTPFRGSTAIKYELPASGQVRLVVFDASGRLVRTLAEGRRQPGVHQLAWDGRDDAARPVAAGVYFYQLQVERRRLTQQTIVLK
ncbi:MAG: FlgD immunoglobulin-like domain containing protein [Candidatus Eisenbacteria bacterium]